VRMKFQGQKVLVGYSGGPDAAALAYMLAKRGAIVVPVYVHYRERSGGKTTKDLRAARASARSLGIADPDIVRSPLRGPKSERNAHLVRVLAQHARANGSTTMALGTIKTDDDPDLDPKNLSREARAFGVGVVTWDYFGIRDKASEFKGITPEHRNFLFETTSCQMWWHVECGNCYSCIARHDAFLKAFGFDPTRYRTGSKLEKAPA